MTPLVATAAAVAAAVHLGVQWVVHLVVYPALAEAARAAPAGDVRAQRVHAGRMGVTIGPVYAALVLTTGALLVQALRSGGAADVAPAGVAAALLLAVLLTTGLAAVPVHERLAVAGPDERKDLHARLARVDLVRLVLAALHLAAVVAAGTVAAGTPAG